jgi:hypothetical protein
MEWSYLTRSELPDLAEWAVALGHYADRSLGPVMEQLVHGSAWTSEPESEPQQQHEDEDDGEGHQANRGPGPEAR